MKLKELLENNENTVMVPLAWLSLEDRKEFIRDGYEVIPIPGYRESDGYRAFKIIGKYSNAHWWIHNFSIPNWEDWKLTAKYAYIVKKFDSTTGIQMFDHLDDDEKIQVFKYYWDSKTSQYFKKYFQEHPELLDRARHSLKEIHKIFKDLFIK